jgi:hypothetical protein
MISVIATHRMPILLGILDDNLIIIHPAVEIPGVDTTADPAEIAGVDPGFDVKPTGIWTPIHGPWTLMSQLMIMLSG